MDRFELPLNILNNLKCELCSEYLSYPPIMLNAESGSVCGRCPSLEAEQNITPLREKNYEQLAKTLLLFPCRYKPHGCSQILSMQEIPNHEKNCGYKPLFCPFLPLGNCAWQGTPDESQAHFATEHPELYLESTIFELNLIEDHKENLLMSLKDNLFVVHSEYSQENDKFYCSVYQVKYIPNVRYTYSIEFQTGDGQNDYRLNSKDVLMYNSDMPRDQGYTIEVVLLKEHLQHPMYITCSVKIDDVVLESSQNEVDVNDILDEISLNDEEDENEEIISAEVDKMLIDIECPVCQEFMIPPIYQCQIGHSICGVCKPQLRECPSCRGGLGNIRNFTLEKLTEHIMYQCKNRGEGCVHKATSKEIRQHEKECKYTPKRCPLFDFIECDWKGMYKSILTHIHKEHLEYFIVEPLSLDLNYSYSENSDEMESIATKFGQLFRLSLSYVNENRKVYTTVQLIGSSEEAEKFMYEAEVFDYNQKKLKCFSKKYCGSINDDIKDNKHCSIWTVDMLVPFMSVDKNIKISFKIVKA